MRAPKHATTETRRPPGRPRKWPLVTGPHDGASNDGKRDELVATLHELYGRGAEVVRRVLDDARTLVDLHAEMSELLVRLRSLQSERPPSPAFPASRATQLPAQATAPPLDSGPRLPRLLPFREVRQRVGLSRSSVWRMERAGQFPPRRRVSVNKVAWWEPEIEEWLQNRLRR